MLFRHFFDAFYTERVRARCIHTVVHILAHIAALMARYSISNFIYQRITGQKAGTTTDPDCGVRFFLDVTVINIIMNFISMGHPLLKITATTSTTNAIAIAVSVIATHCIAIMVIRGVEVLNSRVK